MRARRLRPYVVVLLTLVATASCDAGRGDVAQPERTPASVASATDQLRDRPDREPTREADRQASPYSDWELGARPLPLRPDGLGVMPPTPEELRVRRFPTRDVLPPPVDGRFHTTTGPVTAEVRRRMGATWSPQCPVGLEDLRYVTVTFRGFDGRPHTGELVVAALEADDVVSVFRALYAADFPIEEMRLPTTADLEAPPTGDGNNTAGLVCRPTTGGTSWSAHAYGLAIDLNPFQNPYLKGSGEGRVVLPELASAYLDRGWRRPGMIHADSVVVREFARIGWSWGGAWSTLKDYQHFSATGR